VMEAAIMNTFWKINWEKTRSQCYYWYSSKL
jgi:hypothetical protein